MKNYIDGNALEVEVKAISLEDNYSNVVALYSPKQRIPTEYNWINSSPTQITVSDSFTSGSVIDHIRSLG